MKHLHLHEIIFIIFLLSFMNILNAQEIQEQENVITFALGDFEITTLSEGQNEGNVKVLIDASPAILQEYAPEENYPSATNAFLIKTPDKIILIDAGYGRKLFDNIASRNISPEKVNIILLTHLHGDHIGGLLKDGKATFPNADIYIAQAEYDYWMNSKARGAQAREVIKAYKKKLHLFTPTEIETGGVQLFHGIQAISAYGHTPGHTAFLIESNDSKMLIWGDLTHAMAIQMPHPEIAVTYDTNPQQAIASRKKIFDYVTLNKIPIAGMHIPFPAIGNVKKEENGKYSFETLCLCLGL